MHYFKNILKFFAWIFSGILLLFIVVAFAIQIPSVQNFLIHKATTFVSNKTHTKVEIERIGITFPKAVFIDGLYLEDLSTDTLLYAETIKVNIDMMGLLKSNIHLHSVSLENVTGKLSRSENDSLYNFNFLITAFSGDTTAKDTTNSKSNKGNFVIENVSLSNIRFVFDDKQSGLLTNLVLKELELEMDKMDLKNLTFGIDELLIDGLNGNLIINKKSPNDNKETKNILPKFTANKLKITNSVFNYVDSISTQSINTLISNFSIADAVVDLEKQNISLAEISLFKSDLSLNFTEQQKIEPEPLLPLINSTNHWQVAAKEINLKENQLAYNIINKPLVKNSFDAAHLNYDKVSLRAKNVFYSTDKTEATIKQFSAIDLNGFEVKDLEVKFLMDKNSITANDLKIKTANSSIKANAKIQYSSLQSIKDSLQNLFVFADFDLTEIYSKEVLYFSPQLKAQPFLKGAPKLVMLTGRVSGPIKNLKGENIFIKTGNATTIKTDFIITGLPDAKNAYFYFPDLFVKTSKNDLFAVLGKDLIPQNINLPSVLNLNVKFKGKIKDFETNVLLKSDFGTIIAYAQIDKSENFTGNVQVKNFDVGKLLNNNELFGPVTLNVKVNGKGLDKNSVNANIIADANNFYVNKYVYHNLSINGKVTGQQFEGNINLNDTNIAFDFNGMANITPDKEAYKFSLNLKGADLKNLNFYKDDLRIGLTATVDLKGKDMNTVNGSAGISQIVFAQHGKKYILDSLLVASINQKGKSELNVKSALVGIKYNGTFAPGLIISQIQKHMQHYFPFGVVDTSVNGVNQNFAFEIQLRNHPILSELFFPKLKEFEPGLITGNFDSEKKLLNLNGSIIRINYEGIDIQDFLFKINSDATTFNYQLSSANISNPQIALHNFLLDGKLADQTAYLNVSSIDEKKNKLLVIQTKTIRENENYKLSLNPDNFFIANQQWQIANDNYIAFGKNGFLIHELSLQKASEEITIASVNEKFNDDLIVSIKNFQLDEISRIIEKDTSLAQGKVNGTVFLKRTQNSYGMIADVGIENLGIRQIPIGNLTLKANNLSNGKFDINVKLLGNENDVTMSGYYLPKDSSSSLSIKIELKSLSLKTIETFSMGQVTNSSGKLSGNFSIEGTTKAPVIDGALTFEDVYLNPAALNNRLHFKNETITITPNEIRFNNFMIEDEQNKTAAINGFIKMNHLSDFNFGLNVKSEKFTVFNTTSKDNKVYYGKMIVDSRIDVKGTPDFPVITSKIRLKDGSNFTFVVPEKKLSTDKGEGVVLFVDSLKFHPIITRNEEIEKQKSTLKGFDISSSIEVDNKATLRMMLDPTTNDSLVVRGNASLSFSIDPSGKISLTGAYNLTDGSYLVSLKSIVKKKFEIEKGGTIIWNGDPLDAEVNINAIYNVRTSPIDLVADQVAGLSDADKNSYRERLPFLVYLKLRGALLKPEISFEIQLPPEQKGALGGAVNAKLILLNEDPSALNKQVFALLVLKRFIQENPLESSGGGVSAVARSSVSSFLSAQLNQLSSKVVPGVELSFDVQSYNDYSSGEAQGRTEVGIGLQKQLFNERVTVQVGGTVDVEGERAQKNSASDITGDVTVEYKITEDGRYRLKGFRHNQYEGAIDGQLVETGAGVLYTKNFNRWREFFKAPPKKLKSEDNTNLDE